LSEGHIILSNVMHIIVVIILYKQEQKEKFLECKFN